jgi:hypothetical protein
MTFCANQSYKVFDFETRRVEMIIEYIGISAQKPRSGDIILSNLPSRSGGPSAFLPLSIQVCYNPIMPSHYYSEFKSYFEFCGISSPND